MRAIWDNEKSDTQVEKMTAEDNRGRADNHNGNKGTESKMSHTVHTKKRENEKETKQHWVLQDQR